MLAILSRRSGHGCVLDAGIQTIINQILSILCIDVKLPRPSLLRLQSFRAARPRPGG